MTFSLIVRTFAGREDKKYFFLRLLQKTVADLFRAWIMGKLSIFDTNRTSMWPQPAQKVLISVKRVPQKFDFFFPWRELTNRLWGANKKLSTCLCYRWLPIMQQTRKHVPIFFGSYLYWLVLHMYAFYAANKQICADLYLLVLQMAVLCAGKKQIFSRLHWLVLQMAWTSIYVQIRTCWCYRCLLVIQSI